MAIRGTGASFLVRGVFIAQPKVKETKPPAAKHK